METENERKNDTDLLMKNAYLHGHDVGRLLGAIYSVKHWSVIYPHKDLAAIALDNLYKVADEVESQQ